MFHDETFTTVNQSATVALPWVADMLNVSNMSQYTLLIRLGSDNVPAAAGDADRIVPPLSERSFPVIGRLFGFKLASSPALNALPAGLSNRCQITLTAGERAPAYGQADFSSIYLGTEQQSLYTRADFQASAAPWASSVIAVPSNVRSLILTGVGNNLSQVYVIGQQSGVIYASLQPYTFTATMAIRPPVFTVPFYPALDTTIVVSGTSLSAGIGNGVSVIGSASPYTPSLYEGDGRLSVNPFPAGLGYLPVDQLPGASLYTLARVPDPSQPLAAASRTASTQTGILAPNGARACRVYLNVTVAPGAQTLRVELWGVLPIVFNTSRIDTTVTTIGAAGQYVWEYGPGASGAATLGTIARVATYIPTLPFFRVVHSGAGAWTYSLDVEWFA